MKSIKEITFEGGEDMDVLISVFKLISKTSSDARKEWGLATDHKDSLEDLYNLLAPHLRVDAKQ